MADNVTTVRGVYEAFAKGNVSVLLGVLDDKVEWHEAEHITYWPGGPYVGPQAVLAGVLARIPQDFDGLTIDVRRVLGFGGNSVGRSALSRDRQSHRQGA